MQIANDNTPSRERRRSLRSRVLLTAKLVYDSGVTAACAVRSIGPAGASVRVQGAPARLGAVQLIMVRDGVIHCGRVVWARGQDAGLAFSASYGVADDLPLAVDRSRRIWAELSRP
jgi:hypothetical protein